MRSDIACISTRLLIVSLCRKAILPRTEREPDSLHTSTCHIVSLVVGKEGAYTMFRKTSQLTPPVTVRGVIYGRVSTDEQTENFSLETQVANSTQMAERFGIVLVHPALLDDYTGTKLDR